MKKIIIAQLAIKENKVEQFLMLARKMVEESKSELGCLTYRLHREDLNLNNFIIYERYANQEAVDVHNTSEHFMNFKSSIHSLLVKDIKIEIFNLPL